MMSSGQPVECDLFPSGSPRTDQLAAVVEQYKLILETTESLETRRQSLHTFFMSINSLFLAAIGLVGKESLDTPAVGVAVVLLGLTGAMLSMSWRQQVLSHGRVAASKWEVINKFEAVLPSQPFRAEFEALKRRNYCSFTEVESSVPGVFMALYGVSILFGALLVTNLL